MQTSIHSSLANNSFQTPSHSHLSSVTSLPLSGDTCNRYTTMMTKTCELVANRTFKANEASKLHHLKVRIEDLYDYFAKGIPSNRLLSCGGAARHVLNEDHYSDVDFVHFELIEDKAKIDEFNNNIKRLGNNYIFKLCQDSGVDLKSIGRTKLEQMRVIRQVYKARFTPFKDGTGCLFQIGNVADIKVFYTLNVRHSVARTDGIHIFPHKMLAIFGDGKNFVRSQFEAQKIMDEIKHHICVISEPQHTHNLFMRLLDYKTKGYLVADSDIQVALSQLDGKLGDLFLTHQSNHCADSEVGRIIDLLNCWSMLSQFPEKIQTIAAAFIFGSGKARTNEENVFIATIEKQPELIQPLLALVQAAFLLNFIIQVPSTNSKPQFSAYVFPFCRNQGDIRLQFGFRGQERLFYLSVHGSPIQLIAQLASAWPKIVEKRSLFSQLFKHLRLSKIFIENDLRSILMLILNKYYDSQLSKLFVQENTLAERAKFYHSLSLELALHLDKPFEELHWHTLDALLHAYHQYKDLNLKKVHDALEIYFFEEDQSKDVNLSDFLSVIQALKDKDYFKHLLEDPVLREAFRWTCAYLVRIAISNHEMLLANAICSCIYDIGILSSEEAANLLLAILTNTPISDYKNILEISKTLMTNSRLLSPVIMAKLVPILTDLIALYIVGNSQDHLTALKLLSIALAYSAEFKTLLMECSLLLMKEMTKQPAAHWAPPTCKFFSTLMHQQMIGKLDTTVQAFWQEAIKSTSILYHAIVQAASTSNETSLVDVSRAYEYLLRLHDHKVSYPKIDLAIERIIHQNMSSTCLDKRQEVAQLGQQLISSAGRLTETAQQDLLRTTFALIEAKAKHPRESHVFHSYVKTGQALFVQLSKINPMVVIALLKRMHKYLHHPQIRIEAKQQNFGLLIKTLQHFLSVSRLAHHRKALMILRQLNQDISHMHTEPYKELFFKFTQQIASKQSQYFSSSDVSSISSIGPYSPKLRAKSTLPVKSTMQHFDEQWLLTSFATLTQLMQYKDGNDWTAIDQLLNQIKKHLNEIRATSNIQKEFLRKHFNTILTNLLTIKPLKALFLFEEIVIYCQKIKLFSVKDVANLYWMSICTTQTKIESRDINESLCIHFIKIIKQLILFQKKFDDNLIETLSSKFNIILIHFKVNCTKHMRIELFSVYQNLIKTNINSISLLSIFSIKLSNFLIAYNDLNMAILVIHICLKSPEVHLRSQIAQEIIPPFLEALKSYSPSEQDKLLQTIRIEIDSLILSADLTQQNALLIDLLLLRNPQFNFLIFALLENLSAHDAQTSSKAYRCLRFLFLQIPFIPLDLLTIVAEPLIQILRMECTVQQTEDINAFIFKILLRSQQFKTLAEAQSLVRHLPQPINCVFDLLTAYGQLATDTYPSNFFESYGRPLIDFLFSQLQDIPPETFSLCDRFLGTKKLPLLLCANHIVVALTTKFPQLPVALHSDVSDLLVGVGRALCEEKEYFALDHLLQWSKLSLDEDHEKNCIAVIQVVLQQHYQAVIGQKFISSQAVIRLIERSCFLKKFYNTFSPQQWDQLVIRHEVILAKHLPASRENLMQRLVPQVTQQETWSAQHEELLKSNLGFLTKIFSDRFSQCYKEGIQKLFQLSKIMHMAASSNLDQIMSCFNTFHEKLIENILAQQLPCGVLHEYAQVMQAIPITRNSIVSIFTHYYFCCMRMVFLPAIFNAIVETSSIKIGHSATAITGRKKHAKGLKRKTKWELQYERVTQYANNRELVLKNIASTNFYQEYALVKPEYISTIAAGLSRRSFVAGDDAQLFHEIRDYALTYAITYAELMFPRILDLNKVMQQTYLSIHASFSHELLTGKYWPSSQSDVLPKLFAKYNLLMTQFYTDTNSEKKDDQ